MKELPKTPGRRVLCPENCRYRSKLAPFCGYCMPVVLKKQAIDKEKENNDDSGKGKEAGSGQDQTKDA